MKARIKETGEVIDFKGCSIEHGICTWIGSDNMINQIPMPPGGIEILEKNSDFNSIDWKQSRYELAKAAMQGILSDNTEVGYACSEADYKKGEKHTIPISIARFAIACADALINELK